MALKQVKIIFIFSIVTLFTNFDNRMISTTTLILLKKNVHFTTIKKCTQYHNKFNMKDVRKFQLYNHNLL